MVESFQEKPWKSEEREFLAEDKKLITVRPRGNKLGEDQHLTSEQELSIRKKIIDQHPDQLKLDFALWTRAGNCSAFNKTGMWL